MYSYNVICSNIMYGTPSQRRKSETYQSYSESIRFPYFDHINNIRNEIELKNNEYINQAIPSGGLKL